MPSNIDDLNLSKLKELYQSIGVSRILMKRLAPNDNSKNQIYLGGGFGALGLLPFDEVIPVTEAKVPILAASVRLGWLQPDGAIAKAPGAQLILYPQYPEVRMSGFLRGCKAPPSSILTVRDPDRLLFLGVHQNGTIVGSTARPGSVLAKSVNEVGLFTQSGVFEEIPLATVGPDSKTVLLHELARIHDLGWIGSKKMIAPGQFGPCDAPHCGGLTLEAELGIMQNGYAEPDFLGWEVKQHTVSSFSNVEVGVLTLMTPEPTGGYYRDEGVEQFVRRFGYPDKRGVPDRLNFGGIHRANIEHPTTKLTLRTRGFNSTKKTIEDVNGHVELVAHDDTVAASWDFTGLLKHWNRKHAKAAYVPSMMQKAERRSYRFGPQVRLAEGGDPLLFLSALSSGKVYYDPGIKLENASSPKPSTKRRSQFRIRSKELSALYGRMYGVDVSH